MEGNDDTGRPSKPSSKENNPISQFYTSLDPLIHFFGHFSVLFLYFFLILFVFSFFRLFVFLPFSPSRFFDTPNSAETVESGVLFYDNGVVKICRCDVLDAKVLRVTALSLRNAQ